MQKNFLEYCYMIDVKVAFEGLKGEKTKGLKAALKICERTRYVYDGSTDSRCQ